MHLDELRAVACFSLREHPYLLIWIVALPIRLDQLPSSRLIAATVPVGLGEAREESPRRRLGRGVPTAYLSPGGIAGRVPDASVDVATSPPATRRELRALARGRLAPRFASRFPTTFTPEVFQDKNRMTHMLAARRSG